MCALRSWTSAANLAGSDITYDVLATPTQRNQSAGQRLLGEIHLAIGVVDRDYDNKSHMIVLHNFQNEIEWLTKMTLDSVESTYENVPAIPADVTGATRMGRLMDVHFKVWSEHYDGHGNLNTRLDFEGIEQRLARYGIAMNRYRRFRIRGRSPFPSFRVKLT
jgi:hypothetical protein